MWRECGVNVVWMWRGSGGDVAWKWRGSGVDVAWARARLPGVMGRLMFSRLGHPSVK